MTKRNALKKITGGRASRAEVYGLFIASTVIIGGGVGGAIALANSETVSTEPISITQSTTPMEASLPVQSVEAPTPAPPQSDDSNLNSSTNSCPYTPDELNYYNNIRASKQTAVDQAQTEVEGIHLAIASNTAHLEELLAAPYRPIEVFQRHPDGSPAAWRVDSNDEIAFERQRIADNHTALSRAEETLQRAIADRDQIPGC